MAELKCPNCGKIFKVDDNSYADILNQVRGQAFEDELHARLAAVRVFAALPEAPALAAANKRIGRILKKSEGAAPAGNVDAALLQEPAEKALFDALQSVAAEAGKRHDAGDYAGELQTLAALRAPVDAFFDEVLVNAEDAALRANRLALLATLHAAMNRVAELSRLDG